MSKTIPLPQKYEDALQKGDDACRNRDYPKAFYHYARAIIILDQSIQTDLRNYNDEFQINTHESKYKTFLTGYNRIILSLDQNIPPRPRLDGDINWNLLYSKAHNSRGGVLDILQRNVEAIQAYDLALKKNPYNVAAHNNKGQILSHLRNFDQALNEYNAALHIKPRMTWVLINKGIALRTLKQNDDAIDCFNRALKIDEKNTQALYGKAFTLYNQGKYPDAGKCYHHAWQSLVFHQQDRNKQILWRELKKILKKTPSGNLRNELKKLSKTVPKTQLKSELKKLIKTYIGYGLLRCEEPIRNYEKAIRWFERAIDIDIDNSSSSAYKFLGDTYAQKATLFTNKQDYEKALLYYDQAIRNGEKDCSIYIKKGKCILLSKHPEEFLNFCNDHSDQIDLFTELIHECINNWGPKNVWKWIRGIEQKDHITAFNNILFMNEKFWNHYHNTQDVLQEIYIYDMDYKTLKRFEDTELTSKAWDSLHLLWGYQKYLLYLLNVFSSANYNPYISSLYSNNNKHLSSPFKNNDDKIPTIAHYTSEITLNILINTPPHTGHNLKLFSTAVANDPQEGKILHYLLNIDPQDSLNTQLEEKWIIFQACFTSEVDSLNQFRLYGKKEREEGTGFCLELNPSYFVTAFSHATTTLNNEANTSITITPKQNPCNKVKIPLKQPLYHVIYHDPETHRIYYAPASEEQYAELGNHFLGGKTNVKHHEKLIQIRNTIQNIKKIFKKLKSSSSINAQIQAWDNLIFTRHLVKHAAFRNEKELRIISVKKFGDPNLLFLDSTDCHTVDYLSIMDEDYLKAVIGGPKVKDFDRLKEKWLCRLHQYRNNHGQPKTHTAFRQSTAPWRH